MPIYQYKCDGCGVGFEQQQKMADAPITVCPECGQEKVRKVLTTGGILGSPKFGGGDVPPMPSCGMGGGCSSGMCGLG